MIRRRAILKGLATLLLLPAGLGVAARRAGAAAPAGTGFQLVNGWILTDRDVAALAALDRDGAGCGAGAGGGAGQGG